MALPSTIYRAAIQLADTGRDRYASLQTTVARHPSETEERLLARILAYALCYEDDLTFTRGIGAGDEPDLWVKGPDGRTTLWVEVGLPEAERLVKASRHAGRVVLLACGAAFPNWERQQLPKLTGIGNLTVIGIDQGFLAQLAARLERAITWSVTITEGALYLTAGNDTLETELQHLVGSGPA
jgi:uncharacterized protein YaeQ